MNENPFLESNSMSILSKLLTVTFLLFLIGCTNSENSVKRDPNEPIISAASTVLGFVENAQKDPKTAKEKLVLLMESLDAQAETNKGEFIKLRDAAKDLLSAYESKSPDTAQKLENLKATATTVAPSAKAPTGP